VNILSAAYAEYVHAIHYHYQKIRSINLFGHTHHIIIRITEESLHSIERIHSIENFLPPKKNVNKNFQDP